MTTFDEPDAGLLVEHFLPSVLGASYILSQEPNGRNLFFGELGTALEMLRGRLTVISSPARTARQDSPYPWLWRYVDHFHVGSRARAVQHAKLWAFHWKEDGGEVLELHVSSTNLTHSAFKSQLQAGWQVAVPLGERSTQATRRTWGMVVPFLEALGASAGTVATGRVERLLALLGRTECPPEVTFVASIPGEKSAARQLRVFEPSEIHVLTPTIGEWHHRTLAAWCADSGIQPDKIRLKWISEAHPWAAESGWSLSNATSENLETTGVRLDRLPEDARLAPQHRDGDSRWSHAKLYLLRSHRKRRLLVTSANWSASAWGAGRAAPRNFELGVVFESQWTDLEAFDEPFDPPHSVPFCVDRSKTDEPTSALEWAEATWDGTRVSLHVRSTDDVVPIFAGVRFMHGPDASVPIVEGKGELPWDDAKRTPLCARFSQGADALEVDVLDLRPPSEFSETPLPEVDPSVEKALREGFLLQRYGGPSVDTESICDPSAEPGTVGVAALPTDYTVPAWTEARAAFRVVDAWRAALEEAAADPSQLERILMDGRDLQALYRARMGPGVDVVVDELRWRLDEIA